MYVLFSVLIWHFIISLWIFLFLCYLRNFYKKEISYNTLFLLNVKVEDKELETYNLYFVDSYSTLFKWSIIPFKNLYLLVFYYVLSFFTKDSKLLVGIKNLLASVNFRSSYNIEKILNNYRKQNNKNK